MNLLFKSVIGSQAYGTSIPTSDIDYKGVYIQSVDELTSFGYKEQIEIGKDECYYEIRRFLQLIQNANPTVLEMLFVGDESIINTSPEFELLRSHRHKFLTKKCLKSFGGYAVAQIQKARGLDKKMNWEKNRVERKTPIDFCYVYLNGKTLPLQDWLDMRGFDQKDCGLVALNHFRDCYALYVDRFTDGTINPNRLERLFNKIFGIKHLGFKGVSMDDSNSIRLSSIPKGMKPQIIMYYGKDQYSTHCRDYKDYITWLNNRNTQRYIDIKNHDQSIDGKNLLHCRRLLDMAIEIATIGDLVVKRPNADYLLSIRRGEIDLNTIIDKAEEDLKSLDQLYKDSSLPDSVDPVFVNNLLLEIRHMYYERTR